MRESGRGTHEDVTVPIRLHAVWESGELGIGQELGPSAQIQTRLRLKIEKLNRDRHAGKIRQKWKKA